MSRSVGYLLGVVSVALAVSGCAGKTLPAQGLIKPRLVYPLSLYPERVEMGGLRAVAIAFAPGRDVYSDPRVSAETKTAPHNNGGLNVLEAGVLPVRLLLTNVSGGAMLVDPDQATVLNQDGVLYQVFTPQQAVERVTSSKAFADAIEGSHLGPLLRSVLGGEVLVEAAMGGVSGAASGGVTGGASGVVKGATGTALDRTYGYEKALRRLISREYTEHAFKRDTLYPGYLADGLVFFPAEARGGRLRLPVYDSDSKRTTLLEIRLER